MLATLESASSTDSGLSYLASRDKLQRAQRSLQVRDIVLEVSQRLSHVLAMLPPVRTIEQGHLR